MERDLYRDLQVRTSAFLDRLVASRPDDVTMADLVRSLDDWTGRLSAHAADEYDQYSGNRLDLPSKGRVMTPWSTIRSLDETTIVATVRFAGRFIGGGNAAHGGSVAMIFDEVLGRLVNNSEKLMVRTAYLTVNYRAVTPLDVDLALVATVVRSEGRKRFVQGTIHHGDILCAEADALFVELRTA